MKKIVFLGTHGQYNIGDELLLETFLTQLGTEHHYFVNSYDPAFTAAQLRPRFQVEVFHTNQERGRFLRYLLQCDLLFFGGGSIVKELYATVGRSRYATLLMVLATVTFTRWVARKPIIMSNIGVGPIKTAWGRFLTKLIIHQVDLLSVRDTKSYQTCLSLGLSPQRVQQTPDAVFVTSPGVLLSTPNAKSDASGLSATPLHLALNLNYNIENPANWETFLDNLEQGLCLAYKARPFVLHALPMQSQFKAENDWEILNKFRQRLLQQIPTLEFHLDRPNSYLEAVAIINQCDLLLAERLHALVMAAIVGKPFLPLIYDVKVRELVKSLEMDAYALDVNQPFAPDRLSQHIAQLSDEREKVQTHLLMRSTTLRQEMNDYFTRVRSLVNAARWSPQEVKQWVGKAVTQ